MAIIRTRIYAALCAAAIGLTGACAQENPTDVGGALLPGGVRTYEVILDASRFVVSDTSFGGYADVREVAFFLLARDFGGVLNANIVSRIDIPATLAVRDSAGNARTDSMPRYFAGRLQVALDTAAARGPTGATLRLFRLAEDYDIASTSWFLRLDTGSVKLPWSRPGGTAGSSIASAPWTPGTDTLRFAVDSATIAAWADTLSPVRGFVIRPEIAGTRLRASDVALVLQARSSIRADTIFTTTVRPVSLRFLFDPAPPDRSGDVVAGGATAFRAFLRLKERLDTLSLPCLDARPGCSIRLADASITAASLLFEPKRPVPGFAAEDSLGLIVRELFVNPAIPLERSLLGPFAGSARRANARLFETGSGVFEIPIGEYIRQFTDGDEVRPSPWIAVTGAPEGATFGLGAFHDRPRLRLVISVGTESRQ